ncbi:Type I Iterative Polyketide synthase (PKS) [Lecanosticta acicola]|uniref:Type I Iterative Polyketide synthase (PKS) n=1 Tax=Lecanosticta acicola TaxID=111012 RepID=A0AAI8YRI6_9PEZI|nr:Type I Iterative Polyketide synthase (PKS) [Lecanosticta acicola]
MPSTEAQAILIRTAYENAGLDFDPTGYFEAHGTGTIIGDPLEFNAIAQSLNGPTRTSRLIVGSVKSNIGHLEGSAGLAGLLKAILTVEKGVITPLAGFGNPNPKLRLDDPNLQLATKLMEWPSSGIRRASVNSFGAGGSNAHVVIDDAASFLQTHGLKGFHRTLLAAPVLRPATLVWSQVTPATMNQRLRTRRVLRHDSTPFLLPSKPVFKESQALTRNFSKPESKLALLTMVSVPLTLAIALQTFPNFTSISSQTPSATTDPSSTGSPSPSLHLVQSLVLALKAASKSSSNLQSRLESLSSSGGQDGQYARMGFELLQYQVFRQHLLDADAYLQTLGCTWSPVEELSHSEGTSKVDNAAYAQPLTTIIQTGLVDLLRSWDIIPKSVVGHSSGEIAAA